MSYSPDKIRNIMFAGHNGAGKTTLAEALLFETKESERHGKTQDGNTIMDFDPEEIKRKVSLSSAVASITYGGVRLNLIDVPGLFDFELGIYEGIMAAESVVVAVSARSGLSVGAEKAYKLAKDNGRSRAFYISKIDTDNADFYKVFEQLKTEFGPSVCPIVVPFVEGDTRIYINLIENKAFAYENGKPNEVPMPDMGHRLEGLVSAMSEAVAETDEALMEKYFEGEAFTQEELIEGVRLGVKTGGITPVFCGVAPKSEAMDLLLKYMEKLLPSSHRATTVATQTNGDECEIVCEESGELVAFVFKTVADPFVGKLSYVKVMRGVLKPDSSIVNARTGEPEKMGKIMFVKGKKQIDTTAISAGDVGAISKLAKAKTGDTLSAPNEVVKIKGAVFPRAAFSMALKPKQKGDESKIATALQKLVEEDVTIAYRVDSEPVQQILSGLGEQHLDVIVKRMKTKFGVEVELVPPKIAYRETIRKKVKAQGKHKKQTGGHGQFGDVLMEFEPISSDEIVFEEKVFGGSVPRNFFPAVEKGLKDAVLHGVIAGYPVVGLKATLLDGSYHPVDSSEMAFKMAAKLAYKAALPDASPVLLEPVGLLKAFVPDLNTGDLMGEVNKRRGRVLGMSPTDEGLQCVEAEIPISEMFNFTTYMRQLTQGRGKYDYAFVRYEPLPANLESKVVEEAKKLFAGVSEEE